MKVKIQLDKPAVVKHQSLAHDAIRRRIASRKSIAMEEAVAWCKENECRGQKALSSGLFPSIKCPKSTNWRLDGLIVTGEEKRFAND